jgi:hypothetical protein
VRQSSARPFRSAAGRRRRQTIDTIRPEDVDAAVIVWTVAGRWITFCLRPLKNVSTAPDRPKRRWKQLRSTREETIMEMYAKRMGQQASRADKRTKAILPPPPLTRTSLSLTFYLPLFALLFSNKKRAKHFPFLCCCPMIVARSLQSGTVVFLPCYSLIIKSSLA